MKKISIAFVVITICFIACGPDEEPTPTYNDNLFSNSWCWVDESGLAATEMTLSSSHSINGIIYQAINDKLTIYEKISGTWVYASANNILNTQILHSKTMQQESTSFKIIKLDAYTMQLRNQETGADETYYKLVKTYDVNKGEEFDIINSSFAS